MVKCGLSEIDGHAFCLGLNASNLFNAASDLQGLIPPITYLIQGAVFRSKHGTSPSGRFSLGIRPLGELVDMYHTRQAKQRHDMVYALLGMSSDDPIAAGLSTDYKTPWETVFQKVVQFSLSSQVAVEISGEQNMAVIQGNGRFLGRVISNDNTQGDRQRVVVDFEREFNPRRKRPAQFTVQSSAKHVQQGDAICLLQGASAPTIVRHCPGGWRVIRITFPLVDKDRPLLWRNCIRVVTEFPDPVELLWDWAASEDDLQVTTPRTESQGQLDGAVRETDDVVMEDADAAIEAKDGDGQTPLMRAASAGLEAVVESVLNRGAYIEATDRDGRTSLSRAAEAGHKNVVRLLLRRGANVEARDGDGRTPLSRAVEAGHENIVRQLVREKRAKVDAEDNSGQTPVSRAASAGNKEVLQLVLRRGGPVDVKDGQGRTPLSWAAESGHKDIVGMLLGRGAAIDLQDDRNGRTPLFWAAKAGRETVVGLLLEKGAQIDVEDGDGRTPLSSAAEGGHVAVVNLLLHAGAKIERMDGHDGRTPLSWAAGAGQEAVVWVLLEMGAELEKKDHNGQTPLLWAAESGHECVVQRLHKRLGSVSA